MLKKETFRAITSLMPALIIIPYLLGFISVNIYFFYSNISTNEAININYLIVGFFNIALLLLPIIPVLFAEYCNPIIFGDKTSVLSKLIIFTIFLFALGFYEILIFFDYSNLNKMPFLLAPFILSFLGGAILFFSLNNLKKSATVLTIITVIFTLLIVYYL